MFVTNPNIGINCDPNVATIIKFTVMTPNKKSLRNLFSSPITVNSKIVIVLHILAKTKISTAGMLYGVVVYKNRSKLQTGTSIKL